MIFRELNELLTFLERIVRYLKYIFSKHAEQNVSQDSIASRFVLLFERHGIHRNQIPRFFDHGLTLADVAGDDRLLRAVGPISLA